jgi:excisionase family DNA binding protein
MPRAPRKIVPIDLHRAPIRRSAAERRPDRIEPGERLLTIAETAAWFKCSRQHIYDLINRGELPCVRVGSLPRITEQSAIRYLEGR